MPSPAGGQGRHGARQGAAWVCRGVRPGEGGTGLGSAGPGDEPCAPTSGHSGHPPMAKPSRRCQPQGSTRLGLPAGSDRPRVFHHHFQEPPWKADPAGAPGLGGGCGGGQRAAPAARPQCTARRPELHGHRNYILTSHPRGHGGAERALSDAHAARQPPSRSSPVPPGHSWHRLGQAPHAHRGPSPQTSHLATGA